MINKYMVWLMSDIHWLEKYPPDRRAGKSKVYIFTKRMMDLMITFLTMPVWLPLIGIIAVLVAVTSPGAPVIFSQMRTGKGGKRFKMYKFRTMVPNAEALKQQYMHLNELQWPDFKITNDPRVTSLGNILRKTSLDELPQLLNVLLGEMSLVGPRPTSFGPETYRLWQTERLDVQPGLTGLWQIIGRGETEFDERLRLDIAYIDRRCLSLDIQILLRTVEVALIRRKGAH